MDLFPPKTTMLAAPPPEVRRAAAGGRGTLVEAEAHPAHAEAAEPGREPGAGGTAGAPEGRKVGGQRWVAEVDKHLTSTENLWFERFEHVSVYEAHYEAYEAAQAPRMEC